MSRTKTAKNKGRTSGTARTQARSNAPRYKNEGQRRLCELELSTTEIGRLLGVNHGLVSRWRTGERHPSVEHQAAMERHPQIAIPAMAWGRSVGWTEDAVATAAAAPTARGATVDTRAELDEQVARYRELLATDLPPDARVKAEGGLSRVLAARARIDGHHISEASILRHPAHQRVMRAVFDALAAHPEAARAVADALKAVSG